MHTLTSSRSEPRQSPSHVPATNLAYESDAQSNHTTTAEYQQTYPTLDRPPSYETSMRNTKNVNHYHATDRQSTRSTRSARSARSTRSARSKGSTRSKRRHEDRQERQADLPWVQITPSSSNLHSDNAPYRHFP